MQHTGKTKESSGPMMNAILIQHPIDTEEFTYLLTEFPQYQFFILPEDSLTSLSHEKLSLIEIIYSDRLTEQEVALLPHLHWVHSPTPYLDQVCTNYLARQENVLITTTKEENISQIGEFALGAALSFTKNLFRWREEVKSPTTPIEQEVREGMWSSSQSTFLQIGLGPVGTEISKYAKMCGFKVWGVEEIPSFHPNCKKTFPFSEYHSLLPASDIVSIALSRDQLFEGIFGEKEMKLVKEDAILLHFGSGTSIDLKALEKEVGKKRFRGVVLDARFPHGIPHQSPLWDDPNVLITSNSSTWPKSEGQIPFNTFVYNLRQFLHGNYSDMKNLFISRNHKILKSRRQ